MIRRLRHTDAGSEVIEMALVTPILLLLILGMVDFGFLFQRYVVLTNAAAEGARVASLPGYNQADVQARVAAYALAGGIGVDDGVVTASSSPFTIVTPGGSSPGSTVTVTHVYAFQFVGPIVALVGGSMGGNVTLTSTSVVRHQVAAAP